MKIFFLRHALAGDPAEWKGDDAARPLTEEGIEKTKRTAATLADLDLGLEIILTSPLIRARQTAEIVAAKLKVKLVEDARLAPGFDEKKLRALCHDYANANALMVVGHEPDFSATISALIGGGRVVCKKGGLALVDLPDAQSRQGELVWLIPPKVLAR